MEVTAKLIEATMVADKALNAVNNFKHMVGLDPIQFSPEYFAEMVQRVVNAWDTVKKPTEDELHALADTILKTVAAQNKPE